MVLGAQIVHSHEGTTKPILKTSETKTPYFNLHYIATLKIINHLLRP